MHSLQIADPLSPLSPPSEAVKHKRGFLRRSLVSALILYPLWWGLYNMLILLLLNRQGLPYPALNEGLIKFLESFLLLTLSIGNWPASILWALAMGALVVFIWPKKSKGQSNDFQSPTLGD